VAAQTLGSTSTTGYAVPRVNLLPPEIAEKSKVRKAQLAMVGTGLAAVAVVGVLYTQQAANVSSAQRSKDEAVADNARLRTELTKLQNVQKIHADVDTARATLATAMHDQILWSRYLHDVTLTIPETVWLTNFSVTMNETQPGGAPGGNQAVLDPGLGTVTIEGVAFTHNDVAAWLESLSHEKGYTNPYFTKADDDHIGSQEVVKFSSTVNISAKALANKYKEGTAR
jgi:Tfp pilus assembly protein PilN